MKLHSSEMIKASLHDLQNHLHLATMEVELAQMDAQKSLDCRKLLRILGDFKQALQELRDQLLAPGESAKHI